MSPVNMNRIESALRVAVKYSEAFNLHDTGAVLKLISDDCIFESSYPAPAGTIYSGKDEIREFLSGIFQDNPRGKIETEEIFGSGHRSILRWKYYYDAEDKDAAIRGIDIFTEKNDLICTKLSVKSAINSPPYPSLDLPSGLY